MNLRQYNNPWNFLNNLQRDIYNANQNSEYNRLNDDDASVSTANWEPSVDISEDDTGFTILADIPGVDPENIDISMEKGVLTIKGERQSETTQETENYRRVERVSGQFYRRFTLPDSANADKIEAKSEHGVLTITIPKQEVAVSRKIEVKH
jgi:HSP20 family protein